MDEPIVLTQSEYDTLLNDQFLLQCLRHAGVDNWDGWDFALEEYNAGSD